MKKPLLALTLVAAATLAACGGRTYEASVTPAPQAVVAVSPTVVYPYPVTGAVATYVQPSGVVVQSVTVLRPGFGRVETIQQVVDYRGTFTGYRRLTLRMDDGSIQVLDTRGPEMTLGARVEITPERNIRYPIG
jgi:hypothetical protein